MEIKGTQCGSLIFPELHWLFYIPKICQETSIYWSLIRHVRRIDEASANRELSVSLIDLLISAALRVLAWFDPLWYMYSFKSAGYLQEGEATREKGRPAGLISSPSDLILKDRLSFPFDSLHCFGSSKRPMESSERMLGFSSSVFRAKPSLEVLEVLVHILTEVNMQVAVLPRISGFLMRELPTPPSLLLQWWKGNKCRMRSLGYKSCSDHFALGGCLGRQVWQGTKREVE